MDGTDAPLSGFEGKSCREESGISRIDEVCGKRDRILDSTSVNKVSSLP